MPEFLGRYELIEKLGQGAMGSVHKARDPRMSRDVAVKTVLHIDNPEIRKLFEREVRAAAALNHPNIVAVYDCELDGNSPFIVMEYVAGESLDKRLMRGRLPFPESLSILREIAAAIDFAHAGGIVHRDIKPGNVMIGSNGRVKLADFGIARILDDESTYAGRDVGTPRYKAPEVLRGLKAERASDQFSLAVMAFRMLTGAFPFSSDVQLVLGNQIVNLPAPPPSSVDPALPASLDPVLLRALNKDPRERYPNCAAFIETISRAFLEAGSGVATPIPIGPMMGAIRENPKDGLNYVWIPPGSFHMGFLPGRFDVGSDENRRHLVTISKGFWIGQTPVTVAAWKRFANASGRKMPLAPSFNKDWAIELQPVVNVSWEDSQQYCRWAGLRLPTEAEWEYAARAGVEENIYAGRDQIAWYLENSGDSAQEVALLMPNAAGLYDVLGNVWEWVADWYEETYYTSSESTDPPGPSSGTQRAIRGGSWYADWRDICFYARGRLEPSYRLPRIGLRCAGN